MLSARIRHTRVAVALLLPLPLACASSTTGGLPAPDAGAGPLPVPVRAPLTMDCCMADGLRIAERYRASAIASRRFTHETLWRALDPILRDEAFRVEEIGRSVHGREIRAITWGRGPTTVLMWSQMHGDESTATMALADLLGWLAADDPDPRRERIAEGVTVTFVPMLNPDGAELFQRQNALGIDVNRDARRLSTPEGRALKAIHSRLQPDFGFNLHDQNARTAAGPEGRQAAIALLAPAFDEARSYNDVRSRARLVAATIVEQLEREIPGRVAKYDDTFNPRAFGDLIQQWETSTVLVESGALPDDPDKQRLRRVNVGILLTALDAIATGRYRDADPDLYEDLPYNASITRDVLVMGGTMVLPDGRTFVADLGFTYDDALTQSGDLRLREVGDLEGSTALDTVDARGLFLHIEPAMLATRGGNAWLRLGAEANLVIRRAESRTSAIVRRLGGG